MPPAGYPAFLQYLQSGRVSKVQLIDATSFFVKMRKSLGNKRNEIGDGSNGKPDQIGEITNLYGDFDENEYSKIFDNEDFGYWRITVERPLRLNFVVDDERLARLKESSGFQGLAESRKKGAAGQKDVQEGKRLQNAILKALVPLRGKPVVKNRDEFTEWLKGAFKQNHVDHKAPLLKLLLAALSERDETADICTDARGNPEPDPDLRDYENVPLKDDIQDYFRREVLPHVPDAWIDEDKTKKGYEIHPFQHGKPSKTRAF